MAEKKHLTEEIAQRLEQIQQGGRLRPRDVVEDARNPLSPLHDQFEWDDGVAAERFRLVQARRLIRSVEYTPVGSKQFVPSVAYVRDPKANGRESGYVRTVDLATDHSRARAAMADELARVTALLDRALRLAEALGLTKQVKHIREQVEALRLVA